MQIVKDDFYNQIKTILQTARDKAYTQINFIMVEALVYRSADRRGRAER